VYYWIVEKVEVRYAGREGVGRGGEGEPPELL
jgi:hypothetical protein